MLPTECCSSLPLATWVGASNLKCNRMVARFKLLTTTNYGYWIKGGREGLQSGERPGRGETSRRLRGFMWDNVVVLLPATFHWHLELGRDELHIDGGNCVLVLCSFKSPPRYRILRVSVSSPVGYWRESTTELEVGRNIDPFSPWRANILLPILFVY